MGKRNSCQVDDGEYKVHHKNDDMGVDFQLETGLLLI